MKGMVFREFLDFAERIFSLEMVEKVIEESHLPSDAAYTTVGTYDHKEMVALLTNLSKESGIGVGELLYQFGQYLFGRFYKNFPDFFIGPKNCFELLSLVDSYIHVEVKKLYKDAELPKFSSEILPDGNTFIMRYQSQRSMADLARGLIRGCIEHFGAPIDLQAAESEDGRTAIFTLKKMACSS